MDESNVIGKMGVAVVLSSTSFLSFSLFLSLSHTLLVSIFGRAPGLAYGLIRNRLHTADVRAQFGARLCTLSMHYLLVYLAIIISSNCKLLVKL